MILFLYRMCVIYGCVQESATTLIFKASCRSRRLTSSVVLYCPSHHFVRQSFSLNLELRVCSRLIVTESLDHQPLIPVTE